MGCQERPHPDVGPGSGQFWTNVGANFHTGGSLGGGGRLRLVLVKGRLEEPIVHILRR